MSVAIQNMRVVTPQLQNPAAWRPPRGTRTTTRLISVELPPPYSEMPPSQPQNSQISNGTARVSIANVELQQVVQRLESQVWFQRKQLQQQEQYIHQQELRLHEQKRRLLKQQEELIRLKQRPHSIRKALSNHFKHLLGRY